MADNKSSAVIAIGGKQYIVREGDVIDVELVKEAKILELQPLMVYSGTKVEVGSPLLKTAKVKAAVVEPSFKENKVTVVKFQAKKRVHTTRGHRQTKTRLKITSIST